MSDDQNKSVDADDLEYDMARDDEDYFDDGGIETVPADEEPTVRIQDIQDLEDDEDDMSDETGISDISDVTDADDGEDDLIVPGRRAGKAAKSGGAPRKSAMLIVGGVAVLALLGGGAMFLMGGGSDAPPPPSADMQVPLPPGMEQPPVETVAGQPVPGQPVPGEPMPGQPMPGQPMPGQPMPGQPPIVDAADPNAIPGTAPPITDPAITDPNAVPGAMPGTEQPVVAGAPGTPGVPAPETPPETAGLPQPAAVPNPAETPPAGSAPLPGAPATIAADQAPPQPTADLPSAPAETDELLEEVPSTTVATAKADAKTGQSDDDAPAGGKADPDMAEPEIPNATGAASKGDEYYDTGTIVNELADLATPQASEYVIVNKSGEASPTSQLGQMGAKALALGRYGAAADIYGDALIRNPSDVTALLGRAIANQKLGNADAAIRDYEKVLTLSPNNKEAQLNLAGLVMTKEPGLVTSKLASLQEKYPDSGGVAAQKALMLANQGNVTQAAQQMDVAITLEPENPMHYYNRAILAERMQDPARAIQNYERALEVDTIYAGGRKVPRDQIYDRLFVLRN
jgi:tetratricopeptide (TPR) repeat protein